MIVNGTAVISIDNNDLNFLKISRAYHQFNPGLTVNDYNNANKYYLIWFVLCL